MPDEPDLNKLARAALEERDSNAIANAEGRFGEVLARDIDREPLLAQGYLDAVAEVARVSAEWLATAKYAARLDALQERGWALIAAMMHALRGLDEETPVDLDDVQGCVSAARHYRAKLDEAIAERDTSRKERDDAVAHRAATNEEIKKLHALIKDHGMCVEDSVAMHEWKRLATERKTERDVAREEIARLQRATEEIQMWLDQYDNAAQELPQFESPDAGAGRSAWVARIGALDEQHTAFRKLLVAAHQTIGGCITEPACGACTWCDINAALENA